MIKEITGTELEQEQFKGQTTTVKDNIVQFPEEYSINEFGEIIRPVREEKQIQENINVQPNESKFTLKQKVAQFLQKNNLFMNLSIVDKFVNRQLNVLPPSRQETRNSSTQFVNKTRENFINKLTNFGAYRNLSPIQRMSDTEKIEQMRRKMEEKVQSKRDNERWVMN